MSTNISKQKREALLAKIKEIRTFISAAPQDENTGNLLSYLSELEKDVNGKNTALCLKNTVKKSMKYLTLIRLFSQKMKTFSSITADR